MFYDVPDDTTLGVLGGHLKIDGLVCGSGRSSTLADEIQNRQIYYRAFAFAPRFIAGLSDLSDEERRDARALLWPPVLSDLSTLQGCEEISKEIYRVSTQLKEKILDLALDEPFHPEHIVVDLPVNRAVVRGGDILTRTEDGHVATPNLFFDPERWSQAYEHQKQCGFVFTQRQFVRLVSAAARIVFFERYQLVMDSGADRASKTAGRVKAEWFSEAAKHNICTSDCADAFSKDVARLVPIRVPDLKGVLPGKWQSADPDLAVRLADQFRDAIPSGLSPGLHQCVLEGIGHLTNFVDTMELGGDLVNRQSLAEKTEFQPLVRNHLRARGAAMQEGTEVGGGETDLVLSGRLVIENKVIDATDAPFSAGGKFSWQARRYSIAISSRVAIVVVAYKPKTESAILPLHSRIQVNLVGDVGKEFVEIRIVVPWGQSVPSGAKPPSAAGNKT